MYVIGALPGRRLSLVFQLYAVVALSYYSHIIVRGLNIRGREPQWGQAKNSIDHYSGNLFWFWFFRLTFRVLNHAHTKYLHVILIIFFQLMFESVCVCWIIRKCFCCWLNYSLPHLRIVVSTNSYHHIWSKSSLFNIYKRRLWSHYWIHSYSRPLLSI